MGINKDKIITLLIGAVLVLACLVGLYWSANKDLKNSVQDYKEIAEAERDSTVHYRNKYGEEVARRRMAEANIEVIKDTYTDDLKEIKKHLGINTKDIRGIFKAITITSGEGEGRVDTVYVDSVANYTFTDRTKWFDLDATFKQGVFKYNYTTRDSITLVPYRERDGLYVKGVSANPNTRITGLQGILVAPKERNKRWGLGPSIQIGYDSEVRITPGLSVQYSLIRF